MVFLRAIMVTLFSRPDLSARSFNETSLLVLYRELLHVIITSECALHERLHI